MSLFQKAVLVISAALIVGKVFFSTWQSTTVPLTPCIKTQDSMQVATDTQGMHTIPAAAVGENPPVANIRTLAPPMRRHLDSSFRLPDYYTQEDMDWFHPLYDLQNSPKKVAFLSLATGKYTRFLPRLVDSTMRFALLHHDVDFHAFTDIPRADLPPYLRDHPNLFVHVTKHLPWPQSTTLRFASYDKWCAKEDEVVPPPGRSPLEALEYDYIFAIDSDAAFVDYVGEELLTDWIGTMHIENAYFNGTEVNGFTHVWTSRKEHADRPGLYHDHGAYLGGGSMDAYRDPPLQAFESSFHSYMPMGVARYYFYGGFYGQCVVNWDGIICHRSSELIEVSHAGGAGRTFCTKLRLLTEWVTEDALKGHKAPVDDESYINAMNYQYPPARVLTSAYMHPDRPQVNNHPWAFDYWKGEMQHNRFPLKILNLNKNKNELLG